LKTGPLTLCALAVGLLLVSAPIFGHHGASAYEAGLTTFKGVITDYQLMNPHTELFFDVTGSAGKIEKWTAEAASALTMSRLGWSKGIFKPGDQITVAGNRAKNGSHTMRLRKVVLANGKEFLIERGEDYADQ
jgi:Family of unknown function (DUF6152)